MSESLLIDYLSGVPVDYTHYTNHRASWTTLVSDN